MEIKAGMLVRFAEVKDRGDEQWRFVVEWEDRGRAMIRLVNAGFRVQPTQIVKTTDLCPAEMVTP